VSVENTRHGKKNKHVTTREQKTIE